MGTDSVGNLRSVINKIILLVILLDEARLPGTILVPTESSFLPSQISRNSYYLRLKPL